MSNTNKSPASAQQGTKQASVAKARPWGQKLLRDKALELLRSGSIAPSTVMSNLLVACAMPTIEVDALSAQPRPMSAEANRIVASALQRSRLPNANVSAILDELVEASWAPKKQPPVERNERPQRPPQGRRPSSPKPSEKDPTVLAAKAPIIVRKSPRLPKSDV